MLAAWLMVGALAPGLIGYLQLAYRATTSNLELDYGEGTVLWQAQNLSDLEKAVHPFGRYPFILFNYPPIYHSALRAAAGSGMSLQTAGRLVSVLSFLGIMLLAARMVRRPSSDALALPCGAAAGLLMAHLPNAWWSVLVRVDTLGILFVFAGLALLLSAECREGGRGSRTGAAFACFVLALYTRHTLIAAPAACLIYLWLEDRRRAIRHALAFGAAGAAILVVLAALTQGEWVRHLFRYNVSPVAWRHGIWLMLDQAKKSSPILALAAVEAFLAVRALALRRRIPEAASERSSLLFTIYFAITAVTSLSIMKDGANVNYLLEWLLAGCVLAALLVLRLLRGAPRGTRPAILAAASLLTLSSMAVVEPLGNSFAVVPSSDSQAAKAHDRLLARLAAIPGDVYSEEMTVLVQAEKEVPAEPASTAFLNTVRLWDESPLVERIQSGRFGAVVVTTSLENRGHFSPKVSAAVKERYRLQEQIGPYLLYRPRGIQ